MRRIGLSLFVVAFWSVVIYVLGVLVLWLVSRPPQHLLLGAGGLALFGGWLYVYRKLGGVK